MHAESKLEVYISSALYMQLLPVVEKRWSYNVVGYRCCREDESVIQRSKGLALAESRVAAVGDASSLCYQH